LLNHFRERIEGVFHEVQNTGRNLERLLRKKVDGFVLTLPLKLQVIPFVFSYINDLGLMFLPLLKIPSLVPLICFSHKTYNNLGATPEYGRKRFLERLEREIKQTKDRYPHANYVGIADGAESNWKFLNEHTEAQILDFYHASGYLGILAEVLHPKQIAEQEQWLKTSCHQLKHELGSAENLYNQMVKAIGEKELTETVKEKLQAAITYFRNHLSQMDYAQFRQKNYPIGSGVTEAACKTLAKQRLCCSGMRWKEKGVSIISSLRALVLTSTRWEQFGNKLDQFWFPVAA
jgi:hypothetical protein